MCDVNDLNFWIDVQNHAFHDTDVEITRAKIGRQRDDAGRSRVDCKLPRRLDKISKSVPKRKAVSKAKYSLARRHSLGYNTDILSGKMCGVIKI